MDDDMVPVPDDLWQEANEHTSRGNFDKAIEIYKYILIRNLLILKALFCLFLLLLALPIRFNVTPGIIIFSQHKVGT